MQLGETANDAARELGRPLDGIRVLALEQMQALPFGTQLLARLGASVIKVEQVGRGDAGRASTPAITRENGEKVGATFLRNNLDKDSIAVDLQDPRGRQLVTDLCGHVDVVCENLGPGRVEKLGLDHETVRATYPAVVYVSVTGFGKDGTSPYERWPAYAAVAEAMSGIYEYSRLPHRPPIINPVGGLGDTGTGMFAVIGILAALRQRDRTGVGQLVDIAMFDAMLAICDLPVNYWSMGQRREPEAEQRLPMILDAFRAADGWFLVQVIREHQFERLAQLIGHPEWVQDPRFSTRQGWREHLEAVIRPAIEGWASERTKMEASRTLAERGLASAPCNHASDVIADAHVRRRHMVVEIPRTDGGAEPVLVAGNPVKLSAMVEGPDRNVPMMGEHTVAVLRDVLGMDDGSIQALLDAGVVAGSER